MHMGQVAPEMQGQNGEHELAVAQSQLLLPLARQTNLRLDRRRPGPGQKFAPKHSLEVKPVPGTYARQEANGKHVRLLHQHFTLDLAGWVENGRKTAEARSKNVCNAGCCCLFFAPFPTISNLLAISPGRQNKLDSTVENQLAPALYSCPTRGTKFAFSPTLLVLFRPFAAAAPPFGQCKYLAAYVPSLRIYSYEYLSRHEFM